MSFPVAKEEGKRKIITQLDHQEIGERLNISKQRANQIEKEALEKARIK